MKPLWLELKVFAELDGRDGFTYVKVDLLGLHSTFFSLKKKKRKRSERQEREICRFMLINTN